MNWATILSKELFLFMKDMLKVLLKRAETTPVVNQVATTTQTPVPTPAPIVEVPTVTIRPSPREHLYNIAKSCIDIDASPKDIAPDDLACAESVWSILSISFLGRVGFPLMTSTIGLCQALMHSNDYIEVDKPDYGDIIIAVTGTGNGTFYHGHTGIVGKNSIMSNNSDNGLWQTKFTQKTWDDYYVRRGGFRNRYFRRINY